MSASLVDGDASLQAVLNTFYRYFKHSIPYKHAGNAVLVEPFLCTKFDTVATQFSTILNQHIHICDQKSFNLLKSAIHKVPVDREGIAWPHLTIGGDNFTVEWILVGNVTTDFLELPPFYRWFLVPPSSQRLFDYTVTLFRLDVIETASSLKHCIKSETLIVGSSPVVQRDITLKMISCSHDDLFVTVFLPLRTIDLKTELAHKQQARTFCVASKQSQWYQKARDYTANSKKLDCHIIINKVPDVMQALLDLTNETQHDILQGYLHSEIHVKEEPIHQDEAQERRKDFLHCRCIEESSTIWKTEKTISKEESAKQPTEEDKKCCEEIKVDKQNTQIRVASKLNVPLRYSSGNCSKCPNSFRFLLLECPMCSRKFRFGLHGNGLKYLVGHIYKDHKRLTGYCLSAIRRHCATLISVAASKKKCFSKIIYNLENI